MRRIVLLLGPVVATVALFACEDSDAGGGTGVFTTDSAPFEAAPPTEGGPDPDAADAPVASQSVTVNVVRGGGPAIGVLVVFHNTAGDVLETTATGANGKASSTPGMTPSQASILLGSGSRRHIITWTAVDAGDELLARDNGDGANGGNYYAVTTQGTFVGTTSLNASIGTCIGYNPASPVTIFMSPDCVRPTTAILARAIGSESDLIAYAFAKGKPAAPTDGGVGAATVGAWAAPTSVTVTAKNLPAQGNDFAGLFEIADTLGFENQTGGINQVNGMTTFQVATGFADAFQAAVRWTPNATPGAVLTVAKRGAPAANTDIDLAGALPTLESAGVVTTTLAQPQAAWTTVGALPLTSTDGGSIFLSWFDSRENAGSWTLIVPPGATSVKAPAMPTSAEPWLPHGANDAGPAVQFGEPTVVFADADIIPNYAAFRRQVGLVIPLLDSFSPDARAVLPSNGTLKLTSFQAPPPGL
jgi:hypothetical protein